MYYELWSMNCDEEYGPPPSILDTCDLWVVMEFILVFWFFGELVWRKWICGFWVFICWIKFEFFAMCGLFLFHGLGTENLIVFLIFSWVRFVLLIKIDFSFWYPLVDFYSFAFLQLRYCYQIFFCQTEECTYIIGSYGIFTLLYSCYS